jgi:hypothetical protein
MRRLGWKDNVVRDLHALRCYGRDAAFGNNNFFPQRAARTSNHVASQFD